MEIDNVKRIARWFAVLPGAILAMLLSAFPLHLVLYQTLTGSGLVEPYPETPERLLGPLVATLAFVWVGTRVAPDRKIETGVTLFGVVLFLIGGSFAAGLTGAHIGNVRFFLSLGGIPLVGAILGAFGGLCLVYRESSHGPGISE